MGSKKNKEKRFQTAHSPQVKDEYNLEDSFKKISPFIRKSNRKAYDITEYSDDLESERFVNSSQGATIGITGTESWSQYTYLDEKISDYQSQNESAHSQLRKDFDDKIDKQVIELRKDIESKLPINWYIWTVAAIVAIVSLIYVLSYRGLISKQEKHSDDIKAVQIQLKCIETTIERVEEDIMVLQKRDEDNTVKDNKKQKSH